METVKLYDTMSRTLRPLEQSDGEKFRFYVCGPTVYGPAHIGNFLTFIRFDVLHRLLKVAGYNPYYVRNITDVDDKTIKNSIEQNESLLDFTSKWSKKFHQDCESLNLLVPDKEPRATDHIQEQIDLIKKLIKEGIAYVGQDGSVYYSVSKFSGYGKLSHFDPEQLQTQDTNSGESANLADEYERDSIADFALWKREKPEDGGNAWESPWGRGRPGWHLECSAMSLKFLGNDFDLHGGGEDLCFPHHENEIAQSEAATGEPFCRHWMHGVHLLVEGKKMSKSLGNFFTLDDLIEKGFHPMEIRLAMLGGHYRQQYNFTLASIEAAESALQKIRRQIELLLETAKLEAESFTNFIASKLSQNWGHFERAWNALCHDLNTPATLGSLHSGLKKAAKTDQKAEAEKSLKAIGVLLFALGLDPFYKSKEKASQIEIPPEIVTLAQQRWEAKLSRNFTKADELRSRLSEAGWTVLDSKNGYELSPNA